MQRPDIPEDKLIFLDIDGVVNHELWYQHLYSIRKETKDWEFSKTHMDPSRVKLLNDLAPAKVVISSSWRYNARTVEGLLRAGLTLEIIGGTDLDIEHQKGCCRGNSIACWLNDHYGSVARDQNFKSFGYLSKVTYIYHDGEVEIKYKPESRILNYVILDDMDDMLLQQKDHFVHVNDVYGITKADIEKAKTILRL